MYILYNNESGEIIGHFVVSGNFAEQTIKNLPDWQGAFEYAEIINGDAYYFDLANTIRPRPIIESTPSKLEMIADNIDSIIIIGLPIPCTITVDGAEYQVDDGEFEFTTDTAGVYRIVVEAFPYIPTSWEVTAA